MSVQDHSNALSYWLQWNEFCAHCSSTPKRVGDFSPGLSRIGDTLGQKQL